MINSIAVYPGMERWPVHTAQCTGPLFRAGTVPLIFHQLPFPVTLPHSISLCLKYDLIASFIVGQTKTFSGDHQIYRLKI